MILSYRPPTVVLELFHNLPSVTAVHSECSTEQNNAATGTCFSYGSNNEDILHSILSSKRVTIKKPQNSSTVPKESSCLQEEGESLGSIQSILKWSAFFFLKKNYFTFA